MDVENVFELSIVSENPVIAVCEIGLTPISPVKWEVGTVEIPDFDRITNLPAVPRLTGAWPVDAMGLVVKLHATCLAIATPPVLLAAVVIVAV